MPFIRKSYFIHRPTKLFLFLMQTFNIPIHQAQKIIDTRKVYQNGKLITDKSAVVEGKIEIVEFIPQSRGLEPLFETKDFAIYDKPSGIMVHPRNRKSGYTLIDEVRHRFGHEANITHRIDKETSGLVLVSKHKKAERILKGMFEAKKIQKSYHAIVKGVIKKKLFIDAPILKNRDYSKVKLKVFVDERGKPAQTIIRPLRILGDKTLIEAIPLTGRQHQIRAHLFHVKHPIVGDPIYGVPTEVAIAYLDGVLEENERIRYTGATRLMLHAVRLDFTFDRTRYVVVSPYDLSKELRS